MVLKASCSVLEQFVNHRESVIFQFVPQSVFAPGLKLNFFAMGRVLFEDCIEPLCRCRVQNAGEGNEVGSPFTFALDDGAPGGGKIFAKRILRYDHTGPAGKITGLNGDNRLHEDVIVLLSRR